jgi:hypothetical protein
LRSRVIEARKAEVGARATTPDEVEEDPFPEADQGAQIVSLPDRQARLPEDNRPPPSVTAYDRLLTRRQPKGTACGLVTRHSAGGTAPDHAELGRR